VHGLEVEVEVTLPAHEGVVGYAALWDSSHDDIAQVEPHHTPGETITIGPTSMLLLRAHD